MVDSDGVEGSKRPAIDWRATVAPIAAAVTTLGVFTELACFLVARGFLNTYGVEPDQVGITPLNAALRMTNTALWIGISLPGIFVFFFFLRGHLTKVVKFVLSSPSTRILSAFAAIGLVATLLFQLSQLGRHVARDSMQGRDGNWFTNSFALDLEPTTGLLYWYDETRRPFKLRLEDEKTSALKASNEAIESLLPEILARPDLPDEVRPLLQDRELREDIFTNALPYLAQYLGQQERVQVFYLPEEDMTVRVNQDEIIFFTLR